MIFLVEKTEEEEKKEEKRIETTKHGNGLRDNFHKRRRIIMFERTIQCAYSRFGEAAELVHGA